MRSSRSGVNTSRTSYEDTWQPLDPNAVDGSSEFGWGAGLDVPGYEDAPPSGERRDTEELPVLRVRDT